MSHSSHSTIPNLYAKKKLTYKEFFRSFIYEIMFKQEIPQNYIKSGIEILSTLQNKVKTIEKKQSKYKKTLYPKEEHLYAQINKINNILCFCILLKYRNHIKDTIKLQKDFGECAVIRFDIEGDALSILMKCMEEKMITMCSFYAVIELNLKNKKIFTYIRNEYGSKVVGELVMYTVENPCMVYTWKEKGVPNKANDISVKLKKEENWRKDIADKLMLEENKAKKSSQQQSKQDSSTKAQQEEREEHEDHEKSTSDDSAEESLQENQIEAQPIHLNHLVFSSNGATGPYTFHPRVVRWDNNDLKMLQQSLNYSSNIAYHNQPKKDLLFAKYLHDIFPVARIWGSKYRDEFFSESENAFNGKTYTAEAVMVIKEQEKESKKKTIRGQVEIGFDREKKNMIYHLYFKPT
ncbi:hypothetical protein NEFER01_2254, partial [Nematocida sp. LUAm1]